MSKVVKCGCGKHHVQSDRTVSFEGRDWDARCAFQAQQETITGLQEQLAAERKKIPIYNALKRIVGGTKCSLCNKPLGTQFKLYGEAFYHSACLTDLGGES